MIDMAREALPLEVRPVLHPQHDQQTVDMTTEARRRSPTLLPVLRKVEIMTAFAKTRDPRQWLSAATAISQTIIHESRRPRPLLATAMTEVHRHRCITIRTDPCAQVHRPSLPVLLPSWSPV